MTTSINATTTTVGGGGGGLVVISGSGGSGVLPPYGGLVGAPESTFELFSRPNGFYIANVVEYNHLSIDFDEKTFDLLVHSVGPEYSSVPIDNTEYNLYQNVPVIIGRTASDIYYLVVENMTFARPQGALEFSIFKLPNVTFRANTTVLSSQSPMANVKVPNSRPILLNAFSLGTVLNMRSSVSATNATLQIQNMTAYTDLPGAPFGYVRGMTLNISAVSASISNELLMNVTSEYDCINGNSTAVPFALYNNSWSEILPFSVNSTSCDITYPLKRDGVVALMLQRQTTAPQGSSVTSTAQSASNNQLQAYYYAIAGLIAFTGVVIVALRRLEATS